MSAAHVGIRVDASPSMGFGHAVRMLALAQELTRRGATVEIFGSLDVAPWLQAGFDSLGAPIRAASDLDRARLDRLVIDGYAITEDTGRRARDHGVHVLAMVDDAFGAHQAADIYVDQNYGARPMAAPPVPAATQLIGVQYALFRDEVVRHIGQRPVPTAIPRILTVFGGSDPFGAGRRIVPLLLATGAPVHLVSVCPRPQDGAELAALALAPGQSIEILPGAADLAALAVTCHGVVSAAGSTTWELLALGLPTASVCVTDNQEAGYRVTVADGITLPGGRLPHLNEPGERDAVVATFHDLLRDPQLRARLGAQGRTLVDGRGRERVADVLLS